MSRMRELFGSCFDENVWWPVLNSGMTGLTVQGLQQPPYTLPRHRSLTCASACAFTTTERALHGFTITSEDLSGVVNALTCYRLRFVELTAGDQSALVGYLFSALMLVPVSKLTREKTYSRVQIKKPRAINSGLLFKSTVTFRRIYSVRSMIF